MGQMNPVADMLDYVIRNNKSYFTTYGTKYKFDDQYAIADYALKVAPQDSAIDYYQLISASCSIHAPGDPPDEGWPFLCKNRNGTLSFSCHIYNNLLKRLGHFEVDSPSCLVHRVVKPNMILKEELESLSPTPIIWHGNGKAFDINSSFGNLVPLLSLLLGAGKRICLDYGFQSYKCFLDKKNMTQQQHLESYTV
jgi:hypothetical protein